MRRSLGWVAEMAGIVAAVDVDRPASDVFANATDPTRFHEWQKGVVDGHLDQPGLPAVGALRRTDDPVHRPGGPVLEVACQPRRRTTHVGCPRHRRTDQLLVRREAEKDMPANVAALTGGMEAVTG